MTSSNNSQTPTNLAKFQRLQAAPDVQHRGRKWLDERFDATTGLPKPGVKSARWLFKFAGDSNDTSITAPQLSKALAGVFPTNPTDSLSHLCHVSLCTNPTHSLYESITLNTSRNACKRAKKCKCNLVPSCDFSLHDLSLADQIDALEKQIEKTFVTLKHQQLLLIQLLQLRVEHFAQLGFTLDDDENDQ